MPARCSSVRASLPTLSSRRSRRAGIPRRQQRRSPAGSLADRALARRKGFTGYEGADYIHAILNGYVEAPADFKLGDGMNYNKYFHGHQIAMPQPLTDGAVTFADGAPNTSGG